MSAKKNVSKEVISLIVDLHKAGLTVRQICEQKGISRRTVYRWVRRFQEGDGQDLPAPKPRSGRPRKIKACTLRLIHRQLKVDPSLTAREIKDKNSQVLGEVSLRSVQERIHNDLLLRSYKARKKPLLTVAQKQKRIAFAKKYLAWDSSQWREVLWSDESTFSVTGSGAKRVYRPSGSDPHLPQYTSKTVKHPPSVMVWGCFGYHGVGELFFLPKNVHMNQYNYLELLCDHLPDSFEKSKASVFMQDGAPCHTAKSVLNWLKDCKVNFFTDWPGNSPDLNPIENLWSIVKRKLQTRDTSSLPKLEAAIREVWGGLDQETLNNLVDSIPRRLKDVVKRKGNTTKYADRDSQRTGPSNVLSPSSSSFAENSGASTEQAKKRPAAKAKGTQRNQKEEANDIEFGDEVKTKEHEKAPRGRPKKGSSSKSSSSKRKRTSSDKSKETLQKEDEEEKEDGVKKLKVEEERLEEREELEGELEEKPDSLDMIPFQEIKIEEEDPLSAPYPLDDEDNIPEAPGVDLPSRGFFKLEQLSWTDKTDEDKNSIAVAEGDSSKKENKSGRSRKAKAVSKSKESSKEKISEGTEETLKKNPKKQKVDKQQEVNKQQEKLSPEELSKRRYRKILREDSQSELSELSLQLTRDIYDVFGMHVAKTLRDINDIKVFNRVKIKINEILLDALAGYYLNPAFERETSVGTKIPPQDHKSSENTQPSIHCDDSLNQGLEKKTHVTKCSSSPNKDIHKTSLDIDQTQPVSIDQSSCTSQHSMIPETVRIINPPLIIPVNPSQSETSQTRTENPYINTSQDSRTLETTPSIYQPGTILVNFSFPVIPQSNVVGDSRTLETTQSIYQPGIIPLSASFPVIAQSSPAIAQGSAVDDSRTLVTTQSIHQPGTILENSSCPDTARSSVLNPNGNRSQHSRITETSHDTDIRASDPNVTRTRPVDSPSSSSQHSRSTKTSHDTDILASDPNVTRTRPVDSPSSSSQHDGLSETAARGVDAAQTSAVDPTGSISQHSGIPVTAHDKTHHPKVPGKSKKKKTDLNPLQS